MTVKGEGCAHARMCVCVRERDDRYEENVCESAPAHSHTHSPHCLPLPWMEGAVTRWSSPVLSCPTGSSDQSQNIDPPLDLKACSR